jgi:hypothetical protein
MSSVFFSSSLFADKNEGRENTLHISNFWNELFGLCVLYIILYYISKNLSSSGHPVVVPQGKEYNTGIRSSFLHNEYLIYDQTQVAMRYLIKLEMKGFGW